MLISQILNAIRTVPGAEKEDRLLLFRLVRRLLCVEGFMNRFIRPLVFLCLFYSATSASTPDKLSFDTLAIVTNATRTEVIPAYVKPGTQIRILYENQLIGFRQTKIHLGYNGWNLNVPGFSQSEFSENREYYTDLPMSFDSAANLYYVDVTVPNDARSIHYVFCWDSCSNGQWDNNSKRDYGWPIAFPYIGPYLSWDSTTEPTSGVVVSFENPFSAEATLEYWTTTGSFQQTLTDSPKSLHRFVLRDLKPGTTYQYRVISAGMASSVYSFRTHDGSRNLKFIALSDTQNGGEWSAFPTVRDEILKRHNDVDFLLFAGDFTWNDSPGLWWTMFDSARELLASKVMMAAPGNHDTPTNNSNPDTSSFRHYFMFPNPFSTGSYYRFTVGPATFFALNSEIPTEFGPGGIQYNWLQGVVTQRKQDLAEDSHLWTFAFSHIPAVDAAQRHFGQQYSFRAAAALASQVVDFNLSGHEHLYQRFAPLDWQFSPQERYGVGAGAGTGYIVLPPAGAWPESGLAATGTEFLGFAGNNGSGTSSGNGFVRIDISDRKLHLRTFQTGASPNGATLTLVDETMAEKPL
jgi:hypothetical protein